MCEGISEKAPIINQTFLSSSGSSSHTIIHIHHNWLFRALCLPSHWNKTQYLAPKISRHQNWLFVPKMKFGYSVPLASQIAWCSVYILAFFSIFMAEAYLLASPSNIRENGKGWQIDGSEIGPLSSLPFFFFKPCYSCYYFSLESILQLCYCFCESFHHLLLLLLLPLRIWSSRAVMGMKKEAFSMEST